MRVEDIKREQLNEGRILDALKKLASKFMDIGKIISKLYKYYKDKKEWKEVMKMVDNIETDFITLSEKQFIDISAEIYNLRRTTFQSGMDKLAQFAAITKKIEVMLKTARPENDLYKWKALNNALRAIHLEERRLRDYLRKLEADVKREQNAQGE